MSERGHGGSDDSASRKGREPRPIEPKRRGGPSGGGPGGAKGPRPNPRANASKKAGVRPGKRPPLRVFTTTLWEYPSQHYDSVKTGEVVGPGSKSGGRAVRKAGDRAEGRAERGGVAMQGDKAWTGATPSWILWQLLQRYTRKGDRVVDPMAGSGTTLDVAADLGRVGLGFDLAAGDPDSIPGRREDIEPADAREIPLDSEWADFVFLDPPYSTHVDYSEDPRCIGKLDAGSVPHAGKPAGRGASPDEPPPQVGQAYYEAMEEVIAECHRVLKDRKVFALYVSDSFRKSKGKKGPAGGTFMPIGFELFSIMRDYFVPLDIVSVVRHNAKLERGNWHKAAEEENFFLRGFNYLFIMKKDEAGAG